MNITNHCFDRYCERILGISEIQTARQYIATNREKLKDEITKVFDYSVKIYTGQINGDKSTKNYWLRDNIVMVTDTEDQSLITLYRIDFGLGEEIDRAVTQMLLGEIIQFNHEKESLEESIEKEIGFKKTEIENIDNEIEMLKERLSVMQLKKDTLDNEIKIAKRDIEVVNKEIENRALKICNSLEYKKDLAKLNGGK
jgi:predicted  nucleic acid-binding Zn-ribbon protein